MRLDEIVERMVDRDEDLSDARRSRTWGYCEGGLIWKSPTRLEVASKGGRSRVRKPWRTPPREWP